MTRHSAGEAHAFDPVVVPGPRRVSTDGADQATDHAARRIPGPPPLRAVSPRLRRREWVAVRLARGLAALLGCVPRGSTRRLLAWWARGRPSASFRQAARARSLVAAAGAKPGRRQGGAVDATAACLVCLWSHGTWPEWNVGGPPGSTEEHAWVSVTGYPVGEPSEVFGFVARHTVDGRG